MKTLFQQVCLKYPPSLKAFVGLHLLNELQCFSPDFPSLCGQVKHSPGEEAGSALLWRWGLQSSRIQKDPSCHLSCYPSNNIRAWRSQRKKLQAPSRWLNQPYIHPWAMRLKKKEKKNQVPGNSPRALCHKMLPAACLM